MTATGALSGSKLVHFRRTEDKLEVDFVVEIGKSRAWPSV